MQSGDEERWVPMGMDALGRVGLLFILGLAKSVRLISARKATARERRRYEDANKPHYNFETLADGDSDRQGFFDSTKFRFNLAFLYHRFNDDGYAFGDEFGDVLECPDGPQ